MRFFAFLIFYGVFSGGCAEVFLADGLRSVENAKGNSRRLDRYLDMRALACPPGAICSIDGAVELAFNLADAYAQAARNTQETQDILSFGVLLSAGSVALGAIDKVPDNTLARRAISTVAVQNAGSRFVPKTSVQALYEGASRMNCIALAGSIYSEGPPAAKNDRNSDNIVSSKFASFVMVLAMREVEYRTLNGTSRNVSDFSTLLKAFQSASGIAIPAADQDDGPDIPVPSADGGSGASEGVQGENERATSLELQRNPALERFFGVVSSCLDDTAITPTTEPATSSQ